MKSLIYVLSIIVMCQSCSKDSTSSEQLTSLKKFEGDYANVLPPISGTASGAGILSLSVSVKDENTIQLNIKGDSVPFTVNSQRVLGKYDLKFDATVQPFPGQTSAFTANVGETNFTITKLNGGTISGKINGAFKLIWPQIIPDALLTQNPAITAIAYNKK